MKTKGKEHNFGEWIVAPVGHSRMNKKTLGLPTHRTGGSVAWFSWGIWFGRVFGAPFRDFQTFREAQSYARDRYKKSVDKRQLAAV